MKRSQLLHNSAFIRLLIKTFNASVAEKTAVNNIERKRK